MCSKEGGKHRSLDKKNNLESPVKYLLSQYKLPDNTAEPDLRRDQPGADGTAFLTLEGGFLMGSRMKKDEIE